MPLGQRIKRPKQSSAKNENINSCQKNLEITGIPGIYFKNCNPVVKEIIKIVTEYMQDPIGLNGKK